MSLKNDYIVAINKGKEKTFYSVDSVFLINLLIRGIMW